MDALCQPVCGQRLHKMTIAVGVGLKGKDLGATPRRLNSKDPYIGPGVDNGPSGAWNEVRKPVIDALSVYLIEHNILAGSQSNAESFAPQSEPYVLLVEAAWQDMANDQDAYEDHL